MTGFLTGGVCYAARGSAATAYFTSHAMGFGLGTNSYTWWFDTAAQVWHLLVYLDLGTSQRFIADGILRVPAFAACDLDSYGVDRASVLWLVFGAVCLAFGLRFLRGALR